MGVNRRGRQAGRHSAAQYISAIVSRSEKSLTGGHWQARPLGTIHITDRPIKHVTGRPTSRPPGPPPQTHTGRQAGPQALTRNQPSNWCDSSQKGCPRD